MTTEEVAVKLAMHLLWPVSAPRTMLIKAEDGELVEIMAQHGIARNLSKAMSPPQLRLLFPPQELAELAQDERALTAARLALRRYRECFGWDGYPLDPLDARREDGTYDFPGSRMTFRQFRQQWTEEYFQQLEERVSRAMAEPARKVG